MRKYLADSMRQAILSRWRRWSLAISGQRVRGRNPCGRMTVDSLGRQVRCQLPELHPEAHRYMDAYEAVVWDDLSWSEHRTPP
jgi:hypothetical protein